ncbi:GAF domain-containing sensor histidine kinase [Terracidiphilus gabretensis]|uniref:GAF domain-containing sensor histidine kinase n=1 Tax=Terracidiphilus gabretensis TaxID=1577687 RepID=UPI000B08F54A|nr:ATP-binding protein [Terracidiphilus gabretensis]
MRATDWTKTPLGPPDTWSPALRMMARFLLANRFPQLLWWGPQFCCLYNDAYIPILGTKHPWALGRPVSDVWEEIWHVLEPLIKTPFQGGPATWMEDLQLELNRRGFFEETHFTVAYSPVPDESVPGGIGGVLATVHEITSQVIGERRTRVLRELGAHSTEPKSAKEACEFVGKTLSTYAKDIPFLLLYLFDEKQQVASRTCTAGVDTEDRGCPKSIDLLATTDQVWPLSAARATGKIQLIENVKNKFDMPPQGPWSHGPSMAAVAPIRSNLPDQLSGFLVAGLSSHIPFDGHYRHFLELMSTQITTMIGNARAFEQEERRPAIDSVSPTPCGTPAGSEMRIDEIMAPELTARPGADIAMYRLRQEMMRNEEELHLKAESAERQYRTILESISEGFVFIDRKWRIGYANEQWAALVGVTLPEVTGKDLWQVFPELEDTAFGLCYQQAMKTSRPERLEEYYAPLGRWFHTNIIPSAEGISIFVQDVTERHIQQERLLLSEKLAATGRLAATTAHEINNPLESVLNLIYLARISNGQAEKVEEFLSTAENEMTRVSDIARHTLGFYRQSSIPAQIDMQVLLEEVLTVYHSRLRVGGIEVRRDFATVPTIKALRGEMNQVFSNLLSNAIDATRKGGRLSIALRESEHNGTAGVDVRIEDNGSGIPPENLPRLFEAFFTTKPTAGTGLGLWVVKQFVESWGGNIRVTSSTGADSHGTTFTVFLPLVAVKRSYQQDGSAQVA